MAYFIHNKYDKNSIAKVSTSDNINYSYIADNSVIVIDYYGLIERGNNTYKDLDTSSMGNNIIENLVYYSLNSEASYVGIDDITNNLSNNEIKTSLFDILMDIVGKIGVTTDLDASTIWGTINKGIPVIKSIQRGTSTATSSGVTVSISSVVPAKTIVLLNGKGFTSTYTDTSSSYDSSYAYGYGHAGVMLNSLSATSFVASSSYSMPFSWQVIQFY